MQGHVLQAVVIVFWLTASESGAATPGDTTTPATLAGRLTRALDGESIRLAPGNYGKVTFPQRSYDPALRIDASAATFSGLVLVETSGIELTGGAIVAPGGRSYGILIQKARRVRIESMTIIGAHRGIVVGASTDVALVGNTLTGLISDGIDIALSRRVLVDGNICRDFRPVLSVYDASGKRLRNGDHPDCIQAWSRPTAPPTAELTIVNNIAEGNMQGIFLGNHVRNGVDDGGFDRVIIRDNRVTVSYPNGIAALDVRDSVVAGNIVKTVPGAVHGNRPTILVKANLRVRGERNTVCGNIVPSVPKAQGSLPCG